MKIVDLKDDQSNPRVHDKRNIEAIKASLSRFGQVEPLVVQAKTNMVIGGNGRLASMRELGWTECNVFVVDIDDTKARDLSIALNRTAELAEWDLQALAEHLRMLNAAEVDLTSIGWSDADLQPLLQATWEPPSVDPEYEPPSGSGKRTVTFTKEQWSAMQIHLTQARGGNADMSDAEVIVRAVCGVVPAAS